MTMSKDQELAARTYMTDLMSQNLKKLNEIFSKSAGSQEIRDKFKSTELPKVVTPLLLQVLDDVEKRHHESWNAGEAEARDPAYKSLFLEVRKMLRSGSAEFKDKEAMILALQRSFTLEERATWGWADWQKLDTTTMAKDLRDTIALAIPALGETIKKDFKNRDELGPLAELIDWNKPLGISKQAAQSYALSTCNTPPQFNILADMARGLAHLMNAFADGLSSAGEHGALAPTSITPQKAVVPNLSLVS